MSVLKYGLLLSIIVLLLDHKKDAKIVVYLDILISFLCYLFK